MRGSCGLRHRRVSSRLSARLDRAHVARFVTTCQRGLGDRRSREEAQWLAIAGCYLGANSKILVADDIEARSDADALTPARRKFEELPTFPGFELWLGAQRIPKEARTQAAG